MRWFCLLLRSFILPARVARYSLVGILLLFLGAVCGCAAPDTASQLVLRQNKLLGILQNVSDASDRRKRADRHLLKIMAPDNPARLTALVRVVQGYGQAPTMKIYAMDQLMTADKLLGIAVLARQLPRFQHWRVLSHACALARATGNPAMLDPLILSLNRPARRFAIPQRPESLAIRSLFPEGLRRCLAEKLIAGHTLNARLAALSVLYYLQSRKELYSLIMKQGHAPDALMSALHWYARKFGYVPHTAEQVAWIEELFAGRFSRLVQLAQLHCRFVPPAGRHRLAAACKSVTAGNPANRPSSRAATSGLKSHRGNIRAGTCMPDGIPPRLIGLLAMLANPQLFVPRQNLIAIVQRDYASRRHIRRPGPYPGSPDNPNPSWADNAGKLSYCDLLLVQTLYSALARRYFRAELTQLGRRSRHNTRAEEGGLIQLPAIDRPSGHTMPRLRLKDYRSLRHINSGVYMTGPALMLDTPSGLAQYIFHFQKMDNQRYTGPAPGDLRYVRAARCVVVIFTSLSRYSFDATADFPDGAVLDLGVFSKSRTARFASHDWP